jgi:hypothetical protein
VKTAIAKTQGSEKRQALGVIVMPVGKQQRPGNGTAGAHPFRFKFGAQANDARPGINDDQMRTGSDLQARGIAAKLDSCRPGDR